MASGAAEGAFPHDDLKPAIVRGMVWSARGFALTAVCIASVVIAGYVTHNLALVIVAPGLKGMSPLTALGLLLLAASVILESAPRNRLARATSWSAMGLGGLVLCLHLIWARDGLSPVIAAGLFGFDPAQAGRMSPATAICLILLGAAGVSRDKPSRADLFGGLALVVAGLALLGYAYGVRDLYAVSVFNTMGLHTATGMLLLSLASLIVHPERGWASIVASSSAGGGATRRQLAFTLAPPVVGWILLRATDSQRLGPGVAMAFLVALTVAPLALLILRDGRGLNALDAERAAKAQLLAAQAAVLEERLAAQAAELAHQNVEREKAEAVVSRTLRMEAVGQLTGGIAHDFNNLLMGVSGNLSLLKGRLEPEHPGERFLIRAKEALDRGAKLTGQLLAFSRTQKLNIRPVEVDGVLQIARDLVGSALGPGVNLIVRPGAREAWAMTDPDQLELAIFNLAFNARDAMPEGGDLVIESGPHRAVLGEVGKEVDCLSIRVRDTGLGMSAAVAAQAVEPFFTTKEKGKGTGLGLAQVYGFARQCGGDLRITSAPGEGTTVEILLPCSPRIDERAEKAPAIKLEPVTTPSNPLQRLLLVIDDDDAVRSVLVDALRSSGFQVIEASNGVDGLDHLQTHAPAAAIIDFIMPGLNGAEVARRAQKQQPGLPIIFVSGYFDTVTLEGISGAPILRKPFDVESLQRVVASVLH